MPNRRLSVRYVALAALLAVGSVVAAGSLLRGAVAGAATTGPRLQLRGDLRIPPGTGLGVARIRDGWIVAGSDALTRLDEALAPVRTVAPAIPLEWRASGYSRLGDVDVAGDSVYTPFEQGDDTRDRQAVARFDVDTLHFVDAVEVPQHDIAFVAVDDRAHIAYSMDRADGAELFRYDVANGWRPLPPLGIGRTISAVRGADVASGAVWLSTNDARHGVYRIDVRTGLVTDLGSAGHLEGEVGGVDATPRGQARLHVAVAEGEVAVLTDFAIVGEQAPEPVGEGHSGWPPVLVMGAVVLVLASVGAGGVVLYRAWVGLRSGARMPSNR